MCWKDWQIFEYRNGISSICPLDIMLLKPFCLGMLQLLVLLTRKILSPFPMGFPLGELIWNLSWLGSYLSLEEFPLRLLVLHRHRGITLPQILYCSRDDTGVLYSYVVLIHNYIFYSNFIEKKERFTRNMYIDFQKTYDTSWPLKQGYSRESPHEIKQVSINFKRRHTFSTSRNEKPKF